MSIELPKRNKTPISSGVVYDDPGVARRYGRQRMQAADMKTNAALRAGGYLYGIQREAHDSRVRQETADIEADYNKLMQAKLQWLFNSGSLDDHENSGKILEDYHDEISNKVYQNPKLTGETITNFKARAPGKRVSWSSAGTLQGSKMIAANERMGLPAELEGYVERRALKEWEERLDGFSQHLYPAEREIWIRKYHNGVAASNISTAVDDISQAQKSWLVEGRINEARIYVRDEFEKLGKYIDTLDVSGDIKENLHKQLKVKEAEMSRKREEILTLSKENTSRQLMSSMWDNTITLSQVQTAYDKKLISTSLYNSYRTGLLSKSVPSESEKFAGYMESRDAVTAEAAGFMPLEDAKDILNKNVALGFLDGAVGRTLYNELTKDDSEKDVSKAAIEREGLSTLDSFFSATAAKDAFWEPLLEGETETERADKFKAAKARAHNLYYAGLKKLEKDNKYTIPNANHLALQVQRQVFREMEEHRVDFFYNQRPYEGLDIKKLEGLDKRMAADFQKVKEKSPTKYKVGDTVEKGGRKWKIVGFDKDGEPLVEESK